MAGPKIPAQEEAGGSPARDHRGGEPAARAEDATTTWPTWVHRCATGAHVTRRFRGGAAIDGQRDDCPGCPMTGVYRKPRAAAVAQEPGPRTHFKVHGARQPLA